MPSVTVTRKRLYKQVWSEPMRRIAKGFGISDVGLAKICRKHQIPCPPRGYWAKKAAGQSPQQVSLPNPSDDSLIEIRESNGALNGPALSEDLQKQVTDQNGKPFQIELRDHLRSTHSLISEANQLFQTAKYGVDGLIVLPANAPLDLQVSKSSLRRALFIMDALLRAFESHGDPISPGPRIMLLNVTVQFGISEALEAQREEAELADLSGRYEFRHNRFRTKRVPSGRLTLQIGDRGRYWRHKCRQTWRDSPKQPLEGRLEAIIAGLLEFAARVRQQEEEDRIAEEARAAAALRRQEEERQRAIRRAEIKAERKRFEDLIEDSLRWQRSRTLHQYIEAARQAYVAQNGTIEPGSEMETWIEWASRHADWLNPLIDSPPSLLDEDEGVDSHDASHRQQ